MQQQLMMSALEVNALASSFPDGAMAVEAESFPSQGTQFNTGHDTDR